MSVVKVGHMIVCRCDDNPHCVWKFVTGSARSVLRAQLAALVPPPHVVQDRSVEGGLRILCPGHKLADTSIHMPDKRNY